ncbi:hypothetical protein AOLI_G00109130 [Acnodon oligacanthus]
MTYMFRSNLHQYFLQITATPSTLFTTVQTLDSLSLHCSNTSYNFHYRIINSNVHHSYINHRVHHRKVSSLSMALMGMRVKIKSATNLTQSEIENFLQEQFARTLNHSIVQDTVKLRVTLVKKIL